MKNFLRFSLILVMTLSLGLITSSLKAQDVSQRHFLQSRMYLSSLQPAIALQHIQSAIELDHTRGEYFLMRAYVWWQLDRSDLFLKDYQQALSINPKIIPDNFKVKENLPQMIPQMELDDNPFVIDPGEWERRIPQKIGVKLRSSLAF